MSSEVAALIKEISDILCLNSGNVGDAQNCKMEISPKDETPVQKSYYPMSQSLH